MYRGSPWTVLVLLAILPPTQAATAEEIESLRIAASELGILPGTWNFSTDPCVAGWKGINCCTENSTQSCCSFAQQSQLSYPVSPCERTSGARVWMLLLRSDIFGQVLNGSLPQSLCNLTSLRVLDVGTHHLKGQVHGCIGDRLSNLESLRLGDNHLNGTIPVELGKLSNLKELYLDVTEISGEIPPSLGQLNQLTKLVLRSNFLEGGIPDEIGRLTNLVDLELQVNKLTGSLPTSFANLTALTALSLFNNELSGELSASTFEGMSGLSTLNLRRNNFTGRLPALSNSLTVMDFGFNQFSGSIPDIGTPELTDLFLGHNRLNGTIPASFASLSGLVRLDLSHNMLVGSLQSVGGLGETRVSGPTQMDVAFNFFDVSTAPASLLNQQQVPASEALFNCNVSSSVTSNNSCSSRSLPGGRMLFAVNAGGDSVSFSSDNGVRLSFDGDTQTNPSNWSVGLFYGGGGAWALELSGESSGVYTLDPRSINMRGAGNSVEELYSSMRWSSTYLAFHGRDLRSGLYIVTLYFAELVFTEPGYRTFDVILQGQVVKKNLDIVGEAGPRAAYRFNHNVNVSNGFVSVELVHSRSDRFLPPGVWEVQSTGPILSGISVVSVDYRGEKSSALSSGQIAGIVIGGGAVLGILLAVLVLFCVRFRRKTQEKPCMEFVHSSQRTTSEPGSAETSFDVAGTAAMTYQELYEATNGFSEKLGQGGFGAVYKGTLSNGTVVAVKQLLKQNAQVEEDFKKEISIISKVRHRNLLAVIGHSLESDVPMLVCEFIPNGSLDRWLFRKRDEPVLSWEIRRNVAIGVSCGLAYLHDESTYRIIHCDVKPANILLDSDFNPRIADFGLARLYDEKESHVTATRLKGTAGYLAPEYAMHLQLSDKVDVYSFGVVLLELLSGRHAVEFSAPSQQVVLVDWAHQEARLPSTMLEIMDPRLQGTYVEQEARDMASVAILCTQRAVSMRPKMQSVWLMLNGTIKVPEYLENLQNAANHSSMRDFDMSPEFTSGSLEATRDEDPLTSADHPRGVLDSKIHTFKSGASDESPGGRF